ncbi:TetR/AcrR family transcriptional regulator [Demequina sp. NBRC 110057]|uniref:TetR/AcrR family transcriptional regulator n=1 Tax=Demequina sp. NBRC 110057 TaxID=1570346 RepID=UPI000A00737B|nr:TetR/AcrR family transcriptional regulator [Demequina sp. NBRC 110057]
MTSTTPASRGTYPKGERRRAQIVSAAFEAFAAAGFEGASMASIAEACGVSRAGLAHHFPSKDALLIAVLEERDRLNGERFFAGVRRGEDGADYLRRLLAVLEHNTTQREVIALFAKLSTEAITPGHAAHGYFVERYSWLREHLAAALGDLARRGLLREGADVRHLPSELIALMEGLQIQWLVEPAAVDIPARVRARLDEVLATSIWH